MTTIDDTAPDRAADDDRSTVRLEAAGGSPAAAVVDLSGLYAGRHWAARSTGRPFSYRYTAVGDADVTLRRSQISGSIRGLIPVSDDYVVQWLTAGNGIPDVVRDRVPMVDDVPMLFPTDRKSVV